MSDVVISHSEYVVHLSVAIEQEIIMPLTALFAVFFKAS